MLPIGSLTSQSSLRGQALAKRLSAGTRNPVFRVGAHALFDPALLKHGRKRLCPSGMQSGLRLPCPAQQDLQRLPLLEPGQGWIAGRHANEIALKDTLWAFHDAGKLER